MARKQKRFAVIGLGSFGQFLAKALTSAGDEVIAVDADGGVVERMRDVVALPVCLDSTDSDALRSQGIHKVDAAIVTIGENFESAALTVATLKELGLTRIIARAGSDIQARIFRSVGASAIVSPERESALRWVHRLTLPNLEQYVELSENYSIVYVPAPERFWNKTLQQLQLRAEFDVNLVAIRRRSSDGSGKDDAEAVDGIISVPRPDTRILETDVLIVAGRNESLTRLVEF